MENPWNDISLSDYESHMSFDNVRQMQTLNTMIKEQLTDHDAHTAMILGAAGGNGLEHIGTGRYTQVYAVDINPVYLGIAQERYGELGGVLRYLCIDLLSEYGKLPQADLVIADLLVEYIGYDCFAKVVGQVRPRFVSCGIQVDTDEAYVSETPYIHAFDGLDSIHTQIDGDKLTDTMKEAGYSLVSRKIYSLPNGKQLVRLDFE